ncbi:transcription elongation factor GreA [Patescibacteria group bacterium]|nr:transcription elongation factor GreA [Patescibacteria group bacterium]
MVQDFITPEGLERLKEELEYLETHRRKQVASRIKKALEQGDLSENAEYAEAKDEQAFVEGRILEIKAKVKNVKIIEKKKSGQDSEVTVGSTILVDGSMGKKELMIVGSSESDPMNGKISNESPIGKAFLGKAQGDKVEVDAPGGKQEFKILKLK